MTTNMFDFLTDLATNPKRQQAFLNRPEQLLEQLDLETHDYQLLSTKQASKVIEAYSDELAQPAFMVYDPRPDDPLPNPDPPPNPDKSGH